MLQPRAEISQRLRRIPATPPAYSSNFGVFEQRLRRIRVTLYARFIRSYYGGLLALTLGGSTPILRHLRRGRWRGLVGFLEIFNAKS